MHVYLCMYICLPVIGKTSFIVFTITFSTEEVITACSYITRLLTRTQLAVLKTLFSNRQKLYYKHTT